MSYSYPTSNNFNASDIGNFLSYTNSVTSSWISNIILIGVYIVVLSSYYKARNDFWGASAVAGFLTVVIGMVLWLAGFVSAVTLGIAVAILCVSVIALLIDAGQ